MAEQAGDWITGTWMEEQYAGQRKLAGMINTFNNFKSVLSFKSFDIFLKGELSEKIWFSFFLPSHSHHFDVGSPAPTIFYILSGSEQNTITPVEV